MKWPRCVRLRPVRRLALAVVALVLAPDAPGTELMMTSDPELRIDYHAGRDQLALGLAGRLWLVGGDGGTAEPVSPPHLTLSAPRFAPDGSRLLALGGERARSAELWVVTLGDGAARRITAEGVRARDTAWHPDSDRIVYTSDRTGSWQLWSQSLSGGAAVQLTRPPGRAQTPTFSADGGSVHYINVLPDRHELRRQFFTGRPHTVLASRSPLTHPSARPDGTLLTVLRTAPDGRGELQLLLPGPEGGWLKPAPGPVTVASRALAWRDRDHFYAVQDGGVGLHRLATRGRQPVPFTAWLSLRTAPALPARRAGPMQSAPYVLRAARVLDVVRRTYREAHDVHIQDGRILDVAPRRDWGTVPVIDLGDATILPALLDLDADPDVDPRQRRAAGLAVGLDLPSVLQLPSQARHAERLAAIAAAAPDTLIRTRNVLPDVASGVHLADLDAHELTRHAALLQRAGTAVRSPLAGSVQPGTPLWNRLTESRLYGGHVEAPALAVPVTLPPTLYGQLIASSRDSSVAEPLALHGNLLALAAAGVPAPEVIASATWRAAALLGLSDYGQVAPGFVAELAVVGGDPLADVGALVEVIASVSQGEFTSVGTLLDH